jgi:hypothetical protein
MPMSKAKAKRLVRVPLEYFSFDDAGSPIMNGDEQAVETYVAEFRRRSDGEKKDLVFHEQLEPESKGILKDFAEVIVTIEGFEDFPEYTPETVGDVAFEYFNDPDMIGYAERFMLGYQRRTLPSEFFRRISPSSVEVPGTQQTGNQAGT